MMSSRPPNARCHRPWLSTATRWLPSTKSSAPNVRPACACDADGLEELLRRPPPSALPRASRRRGCWRTGALYTAIDRKHVAALIAPVAKHRVRDDVAVDALLRVGHPDQGQALGLEVRQRRVQHALDDGEDGEAAAETDGQRQADGRGEGAFPKQSSDRCSQAHGSLDDGRWCLGGTPLEQLTSCRSTDSEPAQVAAFASD